MFEEDNLKIDLEVPFADETISRIVFDVLRVDVEPKRSGVTKLLTHQENIVKASFSAKQAKQLRVSLTNFFEKIDLIVETIEVMGPPVSANYSHY
ncbi:hypothetical protein ABEB36_002625 [Hypothenemus hampei]|uniref:L antigen family member 3 n=1 Tax=Hypothenemus hampei TaxID=57062 RepID=A0ABD1F6G5_HYPHA